MGHGGTLDPMATGVLILGVGSGTKKLNDFLGCTKSYETVVLFGAATDTYDAVGKVVARKGYEHVTKEMAEEVLGKFRGRIKQRPPIYSALKVKGRKMYEYAREGKEVPIEIQERDVEVKELEMLEWMEGGTHEFHWPREEAEEEVRDVVGQVLELDGEEAGVHEDDESRVDVSPATKRKRDEEPVNGAVEPQAPSSSKRSRASPEPVPFSALQDEAEPLENDDTARSTGPPLTSTSNVQENAVKPQTRPPCPAPAVRLRMTVTSGFYVRSLAHDLGAAVGSVALMSSLVRTRQGEFEIGGGGEGKDTCGVLEYQDLGRGDEVWGPKVKVMLQEWTDKQREMEVGVHGKDVLVPGERRETEPEARARGRRRNSSSSDGSAG